MTAESGEIDFDAILDAFVVGEQERRKREIGHFWATDLGKCKRQVYYGFTIPREFRPTKQRIFRVGSLLHEYLQKVMKAQEGKGFQSVWLERYAKVTDTLTDLIITGRIDLFFIPVAGDPFPVELKSINERGFNLNKEPQFTHKCQLNLYMRSERAKFGYIVYVNKTNLAVRAHRLEYSEGLFNRSMDDMRSVLLFLRQCKLPPKDVRENWECNYCSYKAECDRNDNPALHDRLFPDRRVPVEQIVADD